MILKNSHLKTIYQRYLLAGRKPGKERCPSYEELMKALQSPSRKTRKTVNHIMDCGQCYSIFVFFRDIVQEEQNLLEALSRDYLRQKNSVSFPNKYFWPSRFLRFVPYSLATLAACILLFFLFSHVFMPQPPSVRSPAPTFVLTLTPQNEPNGTISYYLEWNQIPLAHSYSVYVFDLTLKSLWNSSLHENSCYLPQAVSAAIRAGERLMLCLEAVAADNSILQLWIGEITSIPAPGAQKSGQRRRR